MNRRKKLSSIESPGMSRKLLDEAKRQVVSPSSPRNLRELLDVDDCPPGMESLSDDLFLSMPFDQDYYDEE